MMVWVKVWLLKHCMELIKFIPKAKNKLLTAEMSLQGWMKLQPAKSYPPLTWDLVAVIAVQMVRAGYLRCAIGVLLAFDCFLRVGELVNLRVGDVSDSGDVRTGSEYRGIALRLRKTKTGSLTNGLKWKIKVLKAIEIITFIDFCWF